MDTRRSFCKMFEQESIIECNPLSCSSYILFTLFTFLVNFNFAINNLIEQKVNSCLVYLSETSPTSQKTNPKSVQWYRFGSSIQLHVTCGYEIQFEILAFVQFKLKFNFNSILLGWEDRKDYNANRVRFDWKKKHLLPNYVLQTQTH